MITLRVDIRNAELLAVLLVVLDALVSLIAQDTSDFHLLSFRRIDDLTDIVQDLIRRDSSDVMLLQILDHLVGDIGYLLEIISISGKNLALMFRTEFERLITFVQELPYCCCPDTITILT